MCVALPYDVTCEACRYLCAFTWSLRDKLRDVRPSRRLDLRTAPPDAAVLTAPAEGRRLDTYDATSGCTAHPHRLD